MHNADAPNPTEKLTSLP